MRTSKTIREASDATDVAAVGTTFAAAKYNTVALRGGPFLGTISGIVIQVKSIAGGASSLTMRITSDVTGDACVITDTPSTIATGVTTAAEGTAIYAANVNFSTAGGTVYVFCRTDAGTVTIDSVTITWEE